MRLCAVMLSCPKCWTSSAWTCRMNCQVRIPSFTSAPDASASSICFTSVFQTFSFQIYPVLGGACQWQGGRKRSPKPPWLMPMQIWRSAWTTSEETECTVTGKQARSSRLLSQIQRKVSDCHKQPSVIKVYGFLFEVFSFHKCIGILTRKNMRKVLIHLSSSSSHLRLCQIIQMA